MKKQDQIIQEEMRKLITKSCRHLEKKEHNPYYGMQKSLLKFFFSSADVTIDFENDTILLWISDTTNQVSDNLYKMNDAVSVAISYVNLEETLKGCLEKGNKPARFYKTLLFHYNRVADDIGQDAISA